MNHKLQTSDFSYQLPEELIAHFPTPNRSDSRLLGLNRVTGEVQHHQFTEFLGFLRPEDLLVFNDTRVIPARLFGKKESGGKVELLIERVLDECTVLTQLKASKSPKPGTRLLFPPSNGTKDASGQPISQSDNVVATVRSRENDFYKLEFDSGLGIPITDYLEQVGHIPLPPYIKREDQPLDRERYQTVYNKAPGAIAAPTAGLHFDARSMQRLEQLAIETAFVTLHVGAGTFQPVRVASLSSHHMHSERVELSPLVVEKIKRCKQRSGRVIAIGTTTVRSLESAATGGVLEPFQGETELFIYPGFNFKIVDAMVTNFHLPESTLLMLVSAFAGKEKILDAYQCAIAEKYRFFSYGDAMFVY